MGTSFLLSVPMKRCSSCLETKKDFGPDKRAEDGLQSRCRDCARQYDRERYQANRKAKAEYQRRYWNSLSKEEQKRRTFRYELGRYGLDLEQYEQMVKKQKGLCRLCSKPPKPGCHHRLQVDHCHATGKIRGLLCNTCNTALGRLGDSEQGILRLLQYVRGELPLREAGRPI